MRNLWLLPDRTQSGSIRCIENGQELELHKAINLKIIPKEFVLGIPEEVFRRYAKGEYFLFGQLAQTTDGNYIFGLSSPAGVDSEQRSVFISNIQILKDKHPSLDPEIPEAHMASTEDRKWAIKMFSDEGTGSKSIFSPVKNLLNVASTTSRWKSFSSEALNLSLHKPDWTPNSTKKTHIALLTSIRFPILFALIAAGSAATLLAIKFS